MNDDLDLVHEHMLQIIEDAKTMDSVDMEIKWKNFIDKYPSSYKVLCSGMDLEILEKIIEGLKGVQSGRKDMEEAEKDVGTKIAEKFIFPKIGKPPQAEIDKFYEKLKRDWAN